jgi:hypothetical protein
MEFKPASLMIVVSVDGTEDGKIGARNDYRQFGIIKSPYLYGGITFAGNEEKISLKALIKKQPTKSDEYNLNTFVPGNYIMGRETHATAKILDSEKIPGSSLYRLYLTDVVGDFRFSSDASNKVRVYYTGGFSGPFATGGIANQYENIVGLTLSAKGTIISFNNTDREVLIDTTQGSFTTGKNITSGGVTLSSSYILDVSEEFGELLSQVTFGTTSGSDFLLFGGDEIFGRLASTEFVPTEIENLGEYDTTTKIQIVSASPMTDGVLAGNAAIDGTIKQVKSDSLMKVTGDICDFVVTGGLGLTGTLYLSNVKGTFNANNSLVFTPYGTTADNTLSITINSITNPDIQVGSGDLLYIENVRPIQRNIEQSEEFKIVIGF